MFVEKIQLFHFKNHRSLVLNLQDGVNILSGSNGVGKTNCLDAIHYIANGKSYFNSIDSQLILHQENFFTIKAQLQNEDEPTEILIQFEQGKKSIKKNGKAYQRIADHVGFLQTVMISPYDIELVLGASEDRRRFFDMILCQLSTEYLHHLMVYRKVIDQRNALLKQWQGRMQDPDLLESFHAKLIPSGSFIHAFRKKFTEEINPIFQRIYQHLSGGKETPSLQYSSPLNECSFVELLKQNQWNDVMAMRTTGGVHKDDWEFTLNENPLKKFGSQGQIKSFVIALKISQFRYFQEKTGKTPILLLDDIFEKIDEQRAHALMELVASEGFGQIIVTDTHPERVEHHLRLLGGEHNHIQVVNEEIGN